MTNDSLGDMAVAYYGAELAGFEFAVFSNRSGAKRFFAELGRAGDRVSSAWLDRDGKLWIVHWLSR